MGSQVYSSTKLREWLEQWEPSGIPMRERGSPGRTTSGAWRTASGCWSSPGGLDGVPSWARGSTCSTLTGLTPGPELVGRFRALRIAIPELRRALKGVRHA